MVPLGHPEATNGSTFSAPLVLRPAYSCWSFWMARLSPLQHYLSVSRSASRCATGGRNTAGIGPHHHGRRSRTRSTSERRRQRRRDFPKAKRTLSDPRVRRGPRHVNFYDDFQGSHRAIESPLDCRSPGFGHCGSRRQRLYDPRGKRSPHAAHLSGPLRDALLNGPLRGDAERTTSGGSPSRPEHFKRVRWSIGYRDCSWDRLSNYGPRHLVRLGHGPVV